MEVLQNRFGRCIRVKALMSCERPFCLHEQFYTLISNISKNIGRQISLPPVLYIIFPFYIHANICVFQLSHILLLFACIRDKIKASIVPSTGRR